MLAASHMELDMLLDSSGGRLCSLTLRLRFSGAGKLGY
jgi:hypothetical protein